MNCHEIINYHYLTSNAGGGARLTTIMAMMKMHFDSKKELYLGSSIAFPIA